MTDEIIRTAAVVAAVALVAAPYWPHVAKYLAGNLHMLKPSVPGGGAGTPAAVGAPAAGAALDPKTLEGGTQVVRTFVSKLFTTPAPATGGAVGAR